MIMENLSMKIFDFYSNFIIMYIYIVSLDLKFSFSIFISI